MRQQIVNLKLEDERITHYCFGDDWNRGRFQEWFGDKELGKVYEFSMQEYWLNIRFDSSHGREEQPAMYLWTENFVIVVACYDGATSLVKVNKNPVDCNPQSIGGG